jgi:hypothetical protein
VGSCSTSQGWSLPELSPQGASVSIARSSISRDRDLRGRSRDRREMLMARYWWRRWPLFLLVAAVVIAIGFAGQFGC